MGRKGGDGESGKRGLGVAVVSQGQRGREAER